MSTPLGRGLLAAAAAAVLLALAACHRQGPSDVPPPPPRPQLERPVLQLAEARGERAVRVLIPRRALVERGGIPGVFVLDEQGQARFRMVRPGRRTGERIEILAGLKGGERLVLGDLAAVHDGSPITALPGR